MHIILRGINAASEVSGKATAWLICPALVLLVCFDVGARYLFNAPTLWGFDTTWMLSGTIIALGWAYTHKYNGHVRVDLFYARLSPRGKARMDVIGSLLFFYPTVILVTYRSFVWAWQGWAIGEKMQTTFWYPAAGPIRTVMFLGFLLLILQWTARFIGDLGLAVRKTEHD